MNDTTYSVHELTRNARDKAFASWLDAHYAPDDPMPTDNNYLWRLFVNFCDDWKIEWTADGTLAD